MPVAIVLNSSPEFQTTNCKTMSMIHFHFKVRNICLFLPVEKKLVSSFYLYVRHICWTLNSIYCSIQFSSTSTYNTWYSCVWSNSQHRSWSSSDTFLNTSNHCNTCRAKNSTWKKQSMGSITKYELVRYRYLFQTLRA